MIDKKRLYLMIGMARFKERSEDKALRINNYYQRDYVAFAMIRNFLLTTIAYVLLLGLIAVYNMEELLSNLNSLEIRPLVAALVVGYLVFLGIFTVIAYIIARIRYVRMQSSIEQYKSVLSRLNHIYREEDRILGAEEEQYEDSDFEDVHRYDFDEDDEEVK